MLIQYDEDEYETTHERRICAFHLDNPGEAFAGCTCSSHIGSRRRSWQEIATIKAKRKREEEDRILREAEIIKARRGGGQ